MWISQARLIINYANAKREANYGHFFCFREGSAMYFTVNGIIFRYFQWHPVSIMTQVSAFRTGINRVLTAAVLTVPD
jgi:hypothetical protein